MLAVMQKGPTKAAMCNIEQILLTQSS